MSDLKQQDIANQLLSGNFTKAGLTVSQMTDPILDTPMVVTLDQLKPYEHNPRIMRNPLYDEIKQSIRQRGLDSPPTITRRIDEAQFMIRNGGNTRLSILRELWSETKNERFFKIHCLFKPWIDELTALTGHLAESELHGKLTFIEQALAVQKAKEFYEANGMVVSQRDLANKLTENGFPIVQPKISTMQETIRYLLPVIPNILYSGLKRLTIKHILRLRKSADSIWHKYKTDNAINFDDLFFDVLYRFEDTTDEFDLNQLQDELTGRIAQVMNSSYDLIALELSESSSRQKILESPPSPEIEEINEAEFLKKENIHFIEPEMNEEEILAIPLPKVKAEPAIKVTRTSHSDVATTPPLLFDAKEQADDFINDHILSPIETTPRLDAIQGIVSSFTNVVEPDFKSNVIESIPVQAGGLYPISDIWYINSDLNHHEQLRKHISQLVLEIADEHGMASAIKTTHLGLGFTLLEHQSTDQTKQALLNLLSAFASERPGDLSLTQLPSLLTGVPTEIGIQRISDVAFVKLMRVLRLIRRFYELLSNGQEKKEANTTNLF